MTTFLQIAGLIIAALAGGFTALAKIYRWGPFVDNREVPDFTDLPYLPEQAIDSPSVPFNHVVEAPQSPQIAPSAPLAPQAVNTAPKVPLAVFCGYLRDFEGGPGSLNYRLNNPLDCRPSPVGYLPKYEPVEIIDTDTDPRYLYHKGKFAKFPSYAIGWEYAQNMVHFQVVAHPAWTILDFISHFAPSSDKNPTLAYAQNIARRCGTTVDKLLCDLLV